MAWRAGAQEVSFKQRSKDFRTLDPSVWTMSVNGGKRYTLDNVLEHGSYTVLIGNQAFFCSSRLGGRGFITIFMPTIIKPYLKADHCTPHRPGSTHISQLKLALAQISMNLIRCFEGQCLLAFHGRCWRSGLGKFWHYICGV